MVHFFFAFFLLEYEPLALGADALLVDAKVVTEESYVDTIVNQHDDYKISVTGESENN